jgi:hypothetical protein
MGLRVLRPKWSHLIDPGDKLGDRSPRETKGQHTYCSNPGDRYAVPLFPPYGFVDSAKQQSNPLLGMHQKRFTYLQTLVTGAGNCGVTLYPNSLTAQGYTIPGGLNLDANPGGLQDYEKPTNVRCQRVFVEFGTDQLGSKFNLSKLILCGSKDTLPIRGNLM